MPRESWACLGLLGLQAKIDQFRRASAKAMIVVVTVSWAIFRWMDRPTNARAHDGLAMMPVFGGI